MKKILIVILLICCSFLSANGVGIITPSSGACLKLLTSQVDVTVNNQVATTVTTQKFVNNFYNLSSLNYAFPLPNEASATKLRFRVNGLWFTALMAANASGGSGAPQSMSQNLKTFLGTAPLYYNIQQAIAKDSTILVELTYVELLKYRNGSVNYSYPNKYTLIQSTMLDRQSINFNLISQRTIETIQLTSHNGASINNDGHNASIVYNLYESTAVADYKVSYSLSLTELGLFGLSTYLPSNVVPDNQSNGFFMFLAEPSPDQNVVSKEFTIIIDRSGSMTGDKMNQAKEAAKYIVNNLNTGDKFNIISFSDVISSFQADHVVFNQTNQAQALTYISNIQPGGGTNISGAFNTAIPQFANSSNNTANIIIFLTDGIATAGTVDTQEILTSVNGLTAQIPSIITINTFGIGNDANQQLLTLLASQHNGLCTFLSNSELYATITEFYNKIRNPVIINPVIRFSPSSLISEIYPVNLPNLYKGEQLLVVGRYNESVNLGVNFSGTAFGNLVSYNYDMQLSNDAVTENQFLTRIWAKKKIDHLMVQYNSLVPTSELAQQLKQQVIDISLSFGVISAFTNFTGEIIIGIVDNNLALNPSGFELLGNYPNPFNPSTTIKFKINNSYSGPVKIEIFNSLGQLVKTLLLDAEGAGIYSAVWDGKDDRNNTVNTDIYFYKISFGKTQLSGKMLLIK